MLIYIHMLIAIDARFYGTAQAGLGRYTEQLIKHLEKHDLENRYIIILRKNNWEEYTPTNPNFSKVLIDIPWYSLKEQVVFPYLLNRLHADLVHFPHWNVPVLYRHPLVVTIHDLIMYKFPRPTATTLGPLKFWLKDWLHRLVVQTAVRRAKHIIAASIHAKKDIIDTLGVQPENISVTYQAPFVSHITPSDLPAEAIPPYMLYVGASYQHKNLHGLLRAWKIVETKHPTVRLIIVGKNNSFYERLLASEDFKQLTRAFYLGYQPDSTLESLYSHATGYVFPSFYEGFGLPPLEAMLHQIPVTSSRASCLPEILGDAALYFDPADHKQMADCMLRLLYEPETVQKLINRSFAVLSKYSFDRMAEETIQIYKRVDNFEKNN